MSCSVRLRTTNSCEKWNGWSAGCLELGISQIPERQTIKRTHRRPQLLSSAPVFLVPLFAMPPLPPLSAALEHPANRSQPHPRHFPRN